MYVIFPKHVSTRIKMDDEFPVGILCLTTQIGGVERVGRTIKVT
jgi:hypothetical protein